jgi:hypothetical protein
MGASSDMGSLPSPARYFPIRGGRYEVAAGLAKLGKSFGNGDADGHVFQMDRDWPRYREAKRVARGERLGKYYQTHQFEPAVEARVVGFIADRLVLEHPRFFARRGSGLHCSLTGEEVALDRPGGGYASPLDALASQVQEDVAVVSTDAAGRNWLSALHLCFPNRWAAEEKIGREFVTIHEPVAGIGAVNARAGELVRMMVAATEGLVRFAWGITFDDRLNQHPESPPAEFDPRRPTAFVRVERQTIWGFPEVGAALFTIRTYLLNVRDVRQNPEERGQLAAAVRSMPEASLAYKGLAPAKEAMLAWLEAT